MEEKLHFNLGPLTELPVGSEPIISCFKPKCQWRGKVCTMRQTCEEADCPVRAYYMQQIGDAGELGIYAAVQRFMAEYPPIFRAFHVVVEMQCIKVWYVKGSDGSVVNMPDSFEGFPVVKEQMGGV